MTLVVIFDENLVKVAEQYRRKGSKVYVEGQLQTRSSEDRDGQKLYTTEIVPQRYRGELQMLDGAVDHQDRRQDARQGDRDGYGGRSECAGSSPRQLGGYGANKGRGRQEERRADFDDEIPFLDAVGNRPITVEEWSVWVTGAACRGRSTVGARSTRFSTGTLC